MLIPSLAFSQYYLFGVYESHYYENWTLQLFLNWDSTFHLVTITDLGDYPYEPKDEKATWTFDEQEIVLKPSPNFKPKPAIFKVLSNRSLKQRGRKEKVWTRQYELYNCRLTHWKQSFRLSGIGTI